MEVAASDLASLWVPVTIRIAWELNVQVIFFGPEVLHVAQCMFCLRCRNP